MRSRREGSRFECRNTSATGEIPIFFTDVRQTLSPDSPEIAGIVFGRPRCGVVLLANLIIRKSDQPLMTGRLLAI